MQVLARSLSCSDYSLESLHVCACSQVSFRSECASLIVSMGAGVDALAVRDGDAATLLDLMLSLSRSTLRGRGSR